ncbi:MAG: hypothetical protein AB7F88_17330 [Pyrinomonadaceae bacterium]
MNTSIRKTESIDRYDDGIVLDYASMIRMWSAFDRSLAAFNRKCGVITEPQNSEHCAAKDASPHRKG